MLELKAKDEEDFVRLYLTCKRPFIIWVPDNFNYEKAKIIASNHGFYLIELPFDQGKGEVVCRQNPSSEVVKDSRVLQIKWQDKESETQMQLQQQLEEKNTEIKK